VSRRAAAYWLLAGARASGEPPRGRLLIPARPAGASVASQAAIWLRLLNPSLVRMCWTGVLRRAFGDVQGLADLFVGQPPRDQPGDL